MSIVIDVRTHEEFVLGSVPDAINIPLDDIINRVDEIRSLDDQIVIVCASGVRAGFACEYLKSVGIDAVNGGGVL